MSRTTAQKVIELAATQIGYTENPPYSNMTKYGEAFGWDGVAWCVIFVWWLFHELGADDLFCGGERIASCWLEMEYAQNHGLWVTKDYKPGDLVIFDFERDGLIDHTGLVESVTDSGLVTIEGNTSANGSQDNGGAVLRKNRPYSVVYGAYRPQYSPDAAPNVPTNDDTDDDTEEEFEVKLKMIQKGSANAEVKAMQLLLIGYGFSCGNYGADGICGVMTDNAIRAYQRAKGLEQDGICGPITWASLLGVA